MQKCENKTEKRKILNFNQNRLVKHSLKKLFGRGLIETPKLVMPVKNPKPLHLVRFLQEDF